MKTNTKTASAPIYTHEGARAVVVTPELQLRRAVLSTFLWEDSFYESGVSIADRIADLVPKVKARKVADIAIEARTVHNLRHIPLFLAREMLKHESHRPLVSEVLSKVILRADEITEMLALYWKDGKKPLANQLKKGLAEAFTRFNEYALAKYNRDADIKLRDVLFLVHAKPLNAEQDALWKKLIDDRLETPYTWEVELSASTKTGESKTSVWTRLLKDKALGGLAFLRNLRNMTSAGIPESTLKEYFASANFSRVLPFRFISAAQYAPSLEPQLESAMFAGLSEEDKIPGRTVLLIDVSGSMGSKVSGKSELSRLDAACALAILAREICQDVAVYTFSNSLVSVPPRRGFALQDAIIRSQPHGGTDLANAVSGLNRSTSYDRLIVFTDEQASHKPEAPKALGYVINVAGEKNGIGYGPWTHIDGFSEAVVKYISEYERLK